MTSGKILYPFIVLLLLFHSGAEAQNMAVYVPLLKKTYFVYYGTEAPDTGNAKILISFFDHVTRKVPRPVIVSENIGVSNRQDIAKLSIDSRGYIWVFVSGQGRTRPGYIYKSEKPWSIENFRQTWCGEIVFPQAWWMNDTAFLMMHTRVSKGRDLYWTTGKDGSSWAPAQKLAGAGGHFQITNVSGKRLFSVFNVFPGGSTEKQTNLYLVYTDDMGKTWKTIDDEIIDTPISQIENKALVHDYRSEGKLVYIHDLNFDEEGNPVILLMTNNNSKSGPGEPGEWVVVSRRNGTWNHSKVCSMPNNYRPGSLYISENEWRLTGPSDHKISKPVTGGSMVLWISTDRGQTWIKSAGVSCGSPDQSIVQRPLNPDDEFYAFWSEGATEKTPSSILFTNKKFDRVWMLPCFAKKEWDRPVRVK
ncbi:MAG TPA: BNR-4 repeat-containing protein [Bacteroidales bacterium]|nr:BNR-4 repeat-containing protein [Bacteroidales bacterium]